MFANFNIIAPRKLIKSNKSIISNITDIPNVIIEYYDYAEIIITNKDNNEIARTKIDLEDVDKCSKLRWSMRGLYVSSGNRKTSLHEYILKGHTSSKLEFDVIDHKDRDKLNNRKSNLRIITKSQNSFNKQSKGYTFNKKTNKFIASIKVNGKRINLGSFNNERLAIIARKEAEQEYYHNIKL